MINITHNDVKIPLVIGVTGHRDIPVDDIKELKKQIRKIFEYLIDKYRHTPLILLTPLADGADRIVASVALEYENSKIAVSIPLPFDEEETYPETFGSDFFLDDIPSIRKLRWNPKNSKKEFCILREKIRRQNNRFLPTTIPMLFNAEKYKKATAQEQRTIRHKQYSLVGEYIAIHSQILIAIQDPDSEGENGGTAEIVNKKLSGNYEYVTKAKGRVTLPERGLVYRIITPRIKNKNSPTNDEYKLSKLFPYDNKQGYKEVEWKSNDKEVMGIWKWINPIIDFKDNINAKPCLTKTQAELEGMSSFRREHMQINCINKIIEGNYNANEGELITNSISTRVINDLKAYNPKKGQYDEKKVKISIKEQSIEEKLKIKQIISRSAFACLSENFQKITKKYEYILMGLIFASSFTFFVISKFDVPKSITSVIYTVIIISFYYFAIHFKKYKNLYEDTRALSEGLRVQNAWKEIGIDESVAFSYPSSYKDEINWIRTSLRSLNVFSMLQADNPIDPEKEKSVNKNWIKSQIKYFNKYKLLKIIKNRVKKYIKCFGISTIIMSTVLTFNSGYHFIENDKILLFLYVCNGLLITIFSILKSKQLFDANSKIIKEYKLSLAHFRRAKKLLEEKTTKKKNIYKDLGVEALQENTFWTILRREKNYKSPSL